MWPIGLDTTLRPTLHGKFGVPILALIHEILVHRPLGMDGWAPWVNLAGSIRFRGGFDVRRDSARALRILYVCVMQHVKF